MKKIIIALLTICSSLTISAQKNHFGVGIGVANTFFHSTSSSQFDTKYYKVIPRRNLGISFYLIHDLSEKLALTTGLILQPKSYSFVQDKFDMPDVTGSLKVIPKIFAVEVPLLLTYNVKHLNDKYDLVFLVGPDLVLNSTTAVTFKYNLNLKPGTSFDTLAYDNYISNNFSSVLSVDLFAAVKLTKKHEQHRKFDLILSYQYGLMNTERFYFFTNIQTTQSGEKHFNANFSPRLSYISLRLIYYLNRKTK